MMITKGVVLGNYISVDEIRVDPTKIEVILNLPTPAHKLRYIVSLVLQDTITDLWKIFQELLHLYML
jgi:hypothetical protein